MESDDTVQHRVLGTHHRRIVVEVVVIGIHRRIAWEGIVVSNPHRIGISWAVNQRGTSFEVVMATSWEQPGVWMESTVFPCRAAVTLSVVCTW